MSSSTNETKLKCGNPYKTLNLPNFAPSSKIKRAFRDLSLKLHPDKRKPNLSAAENEKLDQQFIFVQEAKSFLLDAEFATQKEKYDLKLKSDALREEQEKKRDEMMDGKRKNMRNSLQEKLRREMEKKHRKSQKGVMTGGDDDDDEIENLKKAGKRMRDQYAEKRQYEEQKDALRERKRQKQELQYRQVRVKWSRAKMGGQSDDMIAKLLSDQFGAVEDVELIGKKGNAALVTFANSKSCKPCVDHYSKSDQLRATYVGKRRDEEEDESDDNDIVMDSLKRERDRESVEERRLRQEAERERILRQMETGEYDENDNKSVETSKTAKKHKKVKSLFPPHFPPEEGRDQKKSHLERLEELETIILKDFISQSLLQEAQVSYLQ